MGDADLVGSRVVLRVVHQCEDEKGNYLKRMQQWCEHLPEELVQAMRPASLMMARELVAIGHQRREETNFDLAVWVGRARIRDVGDFHQITRDVTCRFYEYRAPNTCRHFGWVSNQEKYTVWTWAPFYWSCRAV